MGLPKLEVGKARGSERVAELRLGQRAGDTPSSTRFANPAITIGRVFSDTFAGIAPASAPTFILAQAVGGTVALAVIRALHPHVTPREAATVVVPQAP